MNRDLYLYVFVNLEYDSMGRGRCAAQASHAANVFTDIHIIEPLLNGKMPCKEVMAWRNQAERFGTQIVKAAKNREQLVEIEANMAGRGFISALVSDPEYAVKDGESFHVVTNVLTAAYVFGDKNILGPLLYEYPLLENDQVNRAIQFR